MTSVLDLPVAVLQQPGFAGEILRRIGVERFVTDGGDAALLEQEADRGE